MEESTVDLAGIACPGCHFECKLTAYQCARGKEFYDLGMSGQPVPERRWPMFTPSELAAGRDKRPPLNDRVMHGLNIVSMTLQKRHEQAGAQKVALALGHSGGFMAIGILAKRTRIPRPELDDILEDARQAGLITLHDEPHAKRVATLTEKGMAQVGEWREEQARNTADFLSPLSEEEKGQLEQLVHKLTRMPTPKTREED